MLHFFNKKKEGTTVTFQIEGMHCTSCSMNIDGALEDTEGVLEASTNFASAVTTVKFDSSKVSLESLIEVIADAGYRASIKT